MYVLLAPVMFAYPRVSLNSIWRVAASGSDGPSTPSRCLTEGRESRVTVERTAGVSR